MNDRMDTMLAAFTELVEDKTVLWDPDLTSPHAAVVASLDRTGWGHFEINVSLKVIEGSQLAFVLAVARKYELEVREENGWLTLSRHLTSDDLEEEPEPAEAAAS
jgi:hypothetical protein